MLRWQDPELRSIRTSGNETINGVTVQLHTKAQVVGRETRSSSHLVTFAFKKGRSLLFSWAMTWTQIYKVIEWLAQVDPHFNEKMEPVHDIIHNKLIEEREQYRAKLTSAHDHHVGGHVAVEGCYGCFPLGERIGG